MGRKKRAIVGDSGGSSTAVDARADSLVEWVQADERLLALADRHRHAEELRELCRRFATSESTAQRCFKKLRTHLEYREQHGIDELAQLPARQPVTRPRACASQM